jgi:nickel-dependent lactate racemase
VAIGISNTERALTQVEVRGLLAEALAQVPLAGSRVLVIIPDGTRTASMPLFFRLLQDLLGDRVATLDFLVALGTHPPMNDAALSGLLGVEVRDGMAGDSRVFNHRWDLPETFVTLGTLPASEVAAATDGRMDLDVPVRLNRLVGEPDGSSPYDQIIVVSPVFPHEVAGFSGGNKYFVPGVAGPEIINVTHWIGALLTSSAIIGVAETPVRRLIDRAAAYIPTPRLCIALVMHGQSLHGLHVGSMEEAWRAATQLSARLDIIWVDRPFKRVLSMVPEMYDDLWTAAKGMYKLEPAITDGGEVIIYAPHIDEVSYVHGARSPWPRASPENVVSASGSATWTRPRSTRRTGPAVKTKTSFSSGGPARSCTDYDGAENRPEGSPTEEDCRWKRRTSGSSASR